MPNYLQGWWTANKNRIYNRAKRIFHFKRVGNWIIALCWGIGFTVAVGAGFPPIPKELFYLAYALFFFAFAWSLGSFLTSRHLSKMNPRSWSSKRQKKLQQFARALGYYRIYASVICCAIFALFFFSWWVTYAVKTARELSEMSGMLIPANDPDPLPPYSCRVPPPNDSLRVYYGNSMAFFDQRSSIALVSAVRTSQFGEITRPLIAAQREPNNSIVLNANIIGEDGKVLALISGNKFEINENSIFKALNPRPDRSTIRLKDQYGNEFFVRLLNQHSLKIWGRLFISARQFIDIRENGDVVIGRGSEIGNMCSSNPQNVLAMRE